MIARQREEEANLISWDNTQAMMEADYELALRLQTEEHGELTIEERSGEMRPSKKGARTRGVQLREAERFEEESIYGGFGGQKKMKNEGVEVKRKLEGVGERLKRQENIEGSGIGLDEKGRELGRAVGVVLGSRLEGCPRRWVNCWSNVLRFEPRGDRADGV
ncbi:hypothetical protein Tco_0226248 [Tanacetum coccineum]